MRRLEIKIDGEELLILREEIREARWRRWKTMKDGNRLVLIISG